MSRHARSTQEAKTIDGIDFLPMTICPMKATPYSDLANCHSQTSNGICEVRTREGRPSLCKYTIKAKPSSLVGFSIGLP